MKRLFGILVLIPVLLLAGCGSSKGYEIKTEGDYYKSVVAALKAANAPKKQIEFAELFLAEIQEEDEDFNHPLDEPFNLKDLDEDDLEDFIEQVVTPMAFVLLFSPEWQLDELDDIDEYLEKGYGILSGRD